MTTDAEWGAARIARTKTLIEAYEDAIEALSTGASSYTLDTGQTKQAVTKSNIDSLRLALNNLENRLSTLQARYCGASTRVIPSW